MSPTPYADLGARVLRFRQRQTKKNGQRYTQTDLAAALRTAPIRISKIERGIERPSKAQALWLAEHANIAAHHWDKAELAAMSNDSA